MSTLTKSVLTAAAGGLLLTLAELLIPRSKIKRSAVIAFGLLFLELLTGEILGIFY